MLQGWQLRTAPPIMPWLACPRIVSTDVNDFIGKANRVVGTNRVTILWLSVIFDTDGEVILVGASRLTN
jgi:hypothetical protein